jgi:peptide/nickel transport system substrate-binding protein
MNESLDRRGFLVGLGALGTITFAPWVTACGVGGGSGPSPKPTTRGNLVVAENAFPVNQDGDVSVSSYTWMAFGVAESLTRVTPQMKIEPWLASKVESVDDLTWRVTIRDGVTFSDGSAVDAAAVKASLERSIEKQAATSTLIPKGTRFTADGRKLEIRTPDPIPSLNTSLSAYYFTIKKVASDGRILYTGPFIPTNFVEKQSVVLNAYDGYWGGAPSLKSIKILRILDVSARVLALKSGDVQLAMALLPSDAPKLKSDGFQVISFPFSRQDEIILNVNRPPLDDVNVRRAVALAIDRAALVKGVMDGFAGPAYALAPDNQGLAGLTNTQRFDQGEARRALEAQGWKPGSDGIRTKDGKRLSFKLGSYNQRAELEPLAIAMKDQLKAVGIEAVLETFPDVNTVVANNSFDATMYSYAPALFGDITFGISTLYTSSGTNKGRYNNPQITDLFTQYQKTTDPAKRLDQVKQMQKLIGDDVPVVYVINTVQIVATSAKVKGYVGHPLETYKYDRKLSLDA